MTPFSNRAKAGMRNSAWPFIFLVLLSWFLTGAAPCKEHCGNSWSRYFEDVKADTGGGRIKKFQTDFLAYAKQHPAKDWGASVEPTFNEAIRRQITLGFLNDAVTMSKAMLDLIDTAKTEEDDRKTLERAAGDIRRHVGYPLMILGRLEEADRYLNLELKTVPAEQEGPRFWILTNLGAVLMNQGHYAQAEDKLKQAEAITEAHKGAREFDDLRAWNRLFQSYYFHSTGDLEKGLRFASQAAELGDSTHGADCRAYAYLSKASILKRQKKFNASLESIQKALSTIRTSHPFMFHFELLAVQAAMKNTAAAKKTHTLLANSPSDYKLVFGPLADFYLALAENDVVRAKSFLQIAQKKLSPHNIELQDAMNLIN
jgi:tetratricopeptide (TPR) repeat protein